MDFKKYKNSIDIPVRFNSSTSNWAMAIDFKPGKYRVTISSITFNSDDSYYFTGVQSPEHQIYDYEV